MNIKSVLGFVAAGLLATGSGKANEIKFQLFDNGTFASTGTGQLMGLSYSSSLSASSPLQALTSGGAYGPFALGSFTLVRDPRNDNYQNAIFDLAVTFALPTGLTGGSSAAFVADLTGNIHKPSASQNDQLTIDFGAGSQKLFSFNNGSQQGSFLFSIVDPLLIDLPKGQNSATGTLYGNISNADTFAPTPEPGTLLLLATSLIGLGIYVMRKSQRRAQS